jgi:plastocyanin
VLIAAASLTLVACGGGEKGSALPAHPDVVVGAPRGQGLVFDKTSYTAKAGDIGIAYRNDDVQTHTMIIEDATGKKVAAFPKLVVGSLKTDGATVNLAPGEYKLVCDIHLPTMVATLSVTP